MTEHDMETLKRRGRLLAREKGIGRQKALDLIAVGEGYRHWGDLLASIPKDQPKEEPIVPESTTGTARDWALNHLDTMAGARTGTLDEVALSVVGSISGRLFGIGILGASIASVMSAMVITLLFQISKISNPLSTFRFEDAAVPAINAPLCFVVAAMCWHSPHSVRFRKIRYAAISWCVCVTLFTTLAALAAARDSVFVTGTPPLEAALGPISLMGPVIMAMWIGTYAGRRAR